MAPPRACARSRSGCSAWSVGRGGPGGNGVEMVVGMGKEMQMGQLGGWWHGTVRDRSGARYPPDQAGSSPSIGAEKDWMGREGMRSCGGGRGLLFDPPFVVENGQTDMLTDPN